MVEKEEYKNSYERRRSLLWRDIKDQDDLKPLNIINFFTPSGHTPITGKVFKPPEPEFKVEIDISKCFQAIKEQMSTKTGKPRASMLKLKDYEITMWANLLEYLRSEWSLGERGKVFLTGQEYYALFPKKTVKNKAK